MRVRFGVIALMLVSAFFWGTTSAFAALPEPPFETNAECIACHDVAADAPVFSRVNFSVSELVDYNRCRTCHFNLPDQTRWAGRDVLIHYHAEMRFCHSCHDGSQDFWFPMPEPRVNNLTLTEYGFFANAQSLLASPAALHQIHITEDWVEREFGDEYPQCSRCHASAACSACHVAPVAHENHALPDYPAVPMRQTDGLIVGVTTSTCINPACHAVSQAGLPGFSPGCADVCHVGYEAYHGYESIDHVAEDGVIEGVTCSSCHALDLEAEHQRPSASTTGIGCAVCHPYPRDTYTVWNQSCIQGGCHTVGSADPYHAAAEAGHVIVAAGEVCLACHAGTDLAEIHTAAVYPAIPERRSCLVCHSPVAPSQPATLPATGDCTVCHFTFEQHYDEVAHRSTWDMAGCGGDGCHTTPDLMLAHTEIVRDFTCMDCHRSADPVVIRAIEQRQTACDACHVRVEQDVAHRPVHWASPLLIGAGGIPNYAYWTGSLAGPATTDCAMCHTSNLVDEHMGTFEMVGGVEVVTRLPRYDARGNALSCASCHRSTDLRTGIAIATRQTGCNACHDVHGPIGEIHQSVFAEDPEVSCVSCHSADLTIEHGTGMTATTPSGRQLTGCAICHSYFEGEMGQRSEAAIDARDTRCTACHVTYHDDLTAHLATSTASVAGCGRCHGVIVDGAIDVAPLHAGAPQSCNVCHANRARVPDLAAETAECSSCHAVTGVEYHRNMDTLHEFGAMDPSCALAGCHGSNMLPQVHEPFMDRYPQYTDTCALCHLNTDTARIDWSRATADCSTCHVVHGDIDVIHQAPDSQECVACHRTADVIALHPECGTCHNAAVDTTVTARCVNCHDYSPVEQRHYPAAAHQATLQQNCRACHYVDLSAEHRRPGVGPIGCVRCHVYERFPAVWDRGCTQCHPVYHDQMPQRHVSTNTGCAGAGCHNIQDVATIHTTAAPGGGCSVCHISPSQPATTTNCSTCHPGIGLDRHRGVHDGRPANGVGCEGCHFRFVDEEHLVLGYNCATCHRSTNPVVRAAIEANDLRCLTCHPDSAHNARQAMEFDPRNASMHRVRADLPGMRNRFVVNGITYTWALPPVNTFLLPGWTYDSIVTCNDCHTYTNAAGPHGAAMRINIDPAFPNPFRVTTGNESNTAQLSANSPTGMSMTKEGSQPARIICEKCHDLRTPGGTWSTNAHQEHDDRGREGAYCNQCHVAIPHGWGRPRLLGTVCDPPAYRAWPGTGQNDGGTSRISVRSYTPQGWQEQDCGAACDPEEHPRQGTFWPNIMPGGIPGMTTGIVAGRVTDATTTASVGGATVTVVNVGSATTASDGTYTLANIVPGTYSMTVSRTGYHTWSGSVTVTAGGTTTRNVALSAVAVAPTNLALNRAFTASRSASTTNTPGTAGDGNLSTFWWSNRTGGSTTTEWLAVDLGSRFRVRTVEIAWSGDLWARNYRILVSTDNRNWTEAFRTESGTSAVQRITFSARDARWIRVECSRTGTGRSNGYGVAELRVFQ